MRTEKRQLSNQDIDRLGRYNWADQRLYLHFKKRLATELAEYDLKDAVFIGRTHFCNTNLGIW